MISDWGCLTLAKSGDQSAWQLLVERHGPKLTRMVFFITGSIAVAQDLVQETFFEVFRKGPGHQRGSFSAYLSTIAYHKALKEKKRGASRESLDGIEFKDSAPSPLDGVLVEERDRAIAEVIGSLEKHQRDVLILRFYGEHSYEEIAGILDQPIGTVKSRIFYAVKTCREKLREKGFLE
jgi:RNA polymerase sigma-70 factor (ECF subfamily)